MITRAEIERGVYEVTGAPPLALEPRDGKMTVDLVVELVTKELLAKIEAERAAGILFRTRTPKQVLHDLHRLEEAHELLQDAHTETRVRLFKKSCWLMFTTVCLGACAGWILWRAFA